MRLYLRAESAKRIEYTPEWIKVDFKENNQDMELTLDIRGEIDYKADGLNCRCKGELVPWVLWNYKTGNEINLGELSEEEIEDMFPLKRIADIICKSNVFTIGLYPVNDGENIFPMTEDDTLTDCEGKILIYDGEAEHVKDFTFEAELNC